ncbi:lipopolysaccharide biosynthesis protein [Marinobacter sp. F3R08]|uniref:lipopolysaccharide biosynthesis protein n=1 Tax=Marinobacter sp. F3R08 TaxID=2841559 RepID=UPI001C0939CD|nr:oligosaccharide flippase family protein [Marinobacter sp. F3R08]MBU2954477.1 oligosaccharide flippase family protein [Marinobacter sp. F3R08]
MLLSHQVVAIGAQGTKVLLLAAYLILATRALGPEGYGYVAVATSVALLFVQFVGLGSGVASIRESARDPESFSLAWGSALLRYLCSGLLLGLLYLFLGLWFVDETMGYLSWALVALSEVVLLPLCMVTAYAFMAYGRVRVSLLMQLVAPLLKTCLLLVFLVAGGSLELEAFFFIMAGSTAVASAVSMILAIKFLPSVVWPSTSEAWKVGSDILYSVNSLTNQGTLEGSKPLTMGMSGVADVGLYGAAMRVVSAAALPINSVIQSQSYRLFGYGSVLKEEHFTFLFRYVLAFLLYGSVCFLFFWILSDYIGLLLGEGFGSIGDLVLILGAWLPFYSIRQLIGAVLTTTDRVKERVYLDIASGLFFLGLAVYLIPLYGAVGTSVGIMAAEIFWILIAVIFFKRGSFSSKRFHK